MMFHIQIYKEQTSLSNFPIILKDFVTKLARKLIRMAEQRKND